MHRHTYDLGIIGNCAYLSLVKMDTNIVWMCWPRFDSSFIFGNLLDTKKGGEFSIKPYGEKFSSKQYYVENTNVLCTEIESEEGKYRVTDFAPRFPQYDRYYKPIMLIRKIEPIDGAPRIKVVCDPVGEYGELQLSRRRSSNHITYLGLDEEIRLTTDIALSYILDEEFFVLNETKYLVLTYGAPLEAPLHSTSEHFLSKTVQYWQDWVKNTSIADFYQNQVIRSALALKIHQYEDTGGIIASCTTSLPEFPGSGRTWDYRYCWLRDAYYILNAFNNIGHFEEMEKYFHYIANISVKAKERFQPLYTISAGTDIVEQITDLEGYLGNKPVRIGNQAYEHIQNDVYGQVMVALLPLYIDQRFLNKERFGTVGMIYDTLRKIEKTIDEADAGIWEFRNFSQYHSYSNLFQWAGAQAGLRVARYQNNSEMIELSTRLVNNAAEKIEACYDAERGVYTQAIGTKNLDASTLQLIMMNYLDPNSERARNHLRVVENDLRTPEGLLFRYKHADDFGAPESTFLICAFWYVEALACVGRIDDAMEEFDKLTKFTNHLGLLSEDVHAVSGSQWGNFPQAYSHVGLVNAAYRIAKKIDKPTFL